MIMMAAGRRRRRRWLSRSSERAALGGRGERAEKTDSAAPQPHIEGKSPTSPAAAPPEAPEAVTWHAEPRGGGATRGAWREVSIRGLGSGTHSRVVRGAERRGGGVGEAAAAWAGHAHSAGEAGSAPPREVLAPRAARLRVRRASTQRELPGSGNVGLPGVLFVTPCRRGTLRLRRVGPSRVRAGTGLLTSLRSPKALENFPAFAPGAAPAGGSGRPRGAALSLGGGTRAIPLVPCECFCGGAGRVGRAPARSAGAGRALPARGFLRRTTKSSFFLALGLEFCPLQGKWLCCHFKVQLKLCPSCQSNG